MTRRRASILLLLSAGLALVAPSPRDPQRRIAPRRAAERTAPRLTEEQRRLADARAAMAQGRIDEAREAVSKILPTRLPPRDEEAAVFLKALLLEDGEASDLALGEYLKQFQRGEHRRAATLALAKGKFAGGDYREAENLLSIFSPGVEQDPLGREALVWRGLAELGRGEAEGALQFLQSAKRDLDGSSEEEAFYFALAQAALRANRPGDAVEALRVSLSRHANGDYAPQALFAMGQALEMSGRPADGAALLRQVAQRFPDSYEATRARDRGIRLTKVESTMRPLGGGFAVQIGAFGRREGAERLAQDLRLSGVGDVSVVQGRETPAIYRVRAGAFDARDEARALGERLRRERGLSYTIVPR